ncbi:MAG: hypothetical protein LBU26_05005, partial [Synergistaceae bacterium]|nr:hypothetical protein [Synergistaceae bacterium]
MNGILLLPRASDAAMLYRASGTRKPDDSLAMAERDILTREQALKASVNGSSHTTYKYDIGPDGKRYIVGAEVSILASEDELDSVPGIKTLKTSQKPAKAVSQNDYSKPVSTHDPNEAEVASLKQTEREVISHESAHKGAAGQFGGPVHYTYTTGPDGRRYITGGEVPIHTPATN